MTDRFYGQNNQNTAQSDHDTAAFQIAQALRAVSTATICKVTKCSTAGQVGPIGTLSAMPMVDLVDGLMQASKHVDVLNLPYMRMQAGSKAIIMDPKAGDLGLVVFADRDVSAVKKTKKQASPGSKRRFNMADGMYVGTILSSGDPTCYLQFTDDDKIIASPDNGTTVAKLEANKISLFIGALMIVMRDGKIFLGEDGATAAVETTAGPSSVVFAKV